MDQTLYATSVPFAQWFTVLLRVGAPGALTRVGLFRVNARAAFARDFFRVSAPGSQSSLGTSQGLCARRAEAREIFSSLCATRAEQRETFASLGASRAETLAAASIWMFRGAHSGLRAARTPPLRRKRPSHRISSSGSVEAHKRA